MRQRSPRLATLVASSSPWPWRPARGPGCARTRKRSTRHPGCRDHADGGPLVIVGRLGISTAIDLGAQVAEGVTQVSQAVTVAATNPCSGTGSTLRKTSNGSLTTCSWVGLPAKPVHRRAAGYGHGAEHRAERPGRDGGHPAGHGAGAARRGGHSGSRRVNTLYSGYKRRGGAHGVDCNALDRVRLDIAKALGTRDPRTTR